MPAKSKNRITILSSEAPAIPESFIRSLRGYDPKLHVQWNPKRRRFTILVCTQHLAPTEMHTHICRSEYVFLCQTDDGELLPLSDAVIDEIRRRDVSRAGYGPTDARRFCADAEFARITNDEEIARQQRQIMTDNTRDNKRQLRKAYDLIQRHDMHRIHS